MGIFLRSIAIVGIFVSLLNLYAKAKITAVLPIQSLGVRELLGRNIWLSITLPLLSTILLFLFQHWIFTLGIFLSVSFYLYEILGGILEIKKRPDLLKMSDEKAVTYDIERSITEVEQSPIRAMIPGICGVIGKGVIIFGVAIRLTLLSQS